MARMYSLFSSSKGNVTYIGTEESGLLIDAGVSFRRLSAAMARCGLPLEAVRGVFITHDHADHIGGLRVLAAKLGVPIYAQPVTMRNLIDRDAVPPNARLCAIGGAVQCADMTVTAFETSHDTDQSCGFRVTCADGRSCAVCTDLGVVTKTVAEALDGCDAVLLEANYDPDMLRRGPYPPNVKARIASEHGHLSNEASAAAAQMLVKSGTTRLCLGHLSQENNLPALAEKAVVQGLTSAGFVRGADYLLRVAKPESDGEMIAF